MTLHRSIISFLDQIQAVIATNSYFSPHFLGFDFDNLISAIHLIFGLLWHLAMIFMSTNRQEGLGAHTDPKSKKGVAGEKVLLDISHTYLSVLCLDSNMFY